MSFRKLSLAVGLVCMSGCGNDPIAILLPTAPLTEQQKTQIQKEDAESCGCGRSLDAPIDTATGS